MTLARPLTGAVILLALLGSPLIGAEAPEAAKLPSEVSYYRDIRPLFQQHCQGCHQPARAKGNYVMTNHADLLKPGESKETAVVPGQPDKSTIFTMILPKDGKPPLMPKGKDPLLGRDVELIKKWIVQGAKDDTPASAKQVVVDKEHPPTYTLAPVLTSVAYSPDSQFLAVAGYHEVLIHKADGSGIVARLVGLSETIQTVAYSPDGKFLAASGGDPARFGEVQIWELATQSSSCPCRSPSIPCMG